MGMVRRGTVFSFKGETGGIHSVIISFFVVLKMDSVLRNYFLGKGFAKPRLTLGCSFPPAERGLGNECGWVFGIFLAGRALRIETTNIEISAKPRYKTLLSQIFFYKI